MKNEIQLIDKVQKELMEKREPTIFPLTPTHRKELRQLKARNIGDLNGRLNIIRKLKLEEFKKTNYETVLPFLDELNKSTEYLNADWKKRIKSINKIISARKQLEKKKLNIFQDIHNDWNAIAKLETLQESDRRISVDQEKISSKFLEDEFSKKYGEQFEEVQKNIDNVETMYEEAINFGDLEIVKNLYYTMKTADSFFIKINGLKV